jgi:hypothetical protein
MAREQERPGRYQVLASSAGTGEPATSNHAGDLDAEVIAALHYLAEMINQRLQFWPSRS